MPKKVGLFKAIERNYSLVMDSDKNPLSKLPPGQRLQTMIYLSLMWTAVFCMAAGVWVWYGELLVAHILLALGILATTLEFRTASKLSASSFRPVKTYRDYPLDDGTARYDDVWGG